ncbi:CsbD family protein [Herbiconiux solani]|uniref:CsbD family protein n=1 Tax=Herbiconiux solani TaxID=661329 RepID=UPI0008259482|nr:CsbD family protein [Herbiconiux solani]
MSESYVPVPPSGFEPPVTPQGDGRPGDDDQSGKVEAAKQAAGDVKDTATEQAGHVAGTAKDEAKNVAREAKSQAKDLYAQTQSELKEQAGVQQQRVASGLRSIGDELSNMASNSESQGLATDLVRQVSDRAGSAASWLDSRDPGSLLNEGKSYARRKPGTFIAVAAIAGVVAGRLTRSLAQASADEKDADTASTPATTTAGAPASAPAPAAAPATPAPVVETTSIPGAAVVDETPLYTERASSFGESSPAPEEDYPR